MQDKIIAAIAAYLETRIYFGYRIDRKDAEKLADDIFATAIAPFLEAGANKNIEESKTIVVKVAASLVRNQACEYAEDLNLPKTTPITAIRKFEHEARVWNDTNRLRAIELKRAYDLMK